MVETLFEGVVAASNIAAVAAKVRQELAGYDRFCLWLQGEIGAGKTTFTKHLLTALGLPRDQGVASPTFTYVQEYRFGRFAIAHMDLYRWDQGPEALHELIDWDRYNGFVVEWPEKLGSGDLPPTHLFTFVHRAPTERFYRFLRS